MSHFLSASLAHCPSCLCPCSRVYCLKPHCPGPLVHWSRSLILQSSSFHFTHLRKCHQSSTVLTLTRCPTAAVLPQLANITTVSFPYCPFVQLLRCRIPYCLVPYCSNILLSPCLPPPERASKTAQLVKPATLLNS